MIKDDILDFYDQHWEDHHKVYARLVELLREHEEEIARLKKNSDCTQQKEDDAHEIARLKHLLRQCQDKLDEETHK